MLEGGGGGHLVELTHDDIELTGFTLSGADTLVWVAGASRVRVHGNHLRDGKPVATSAPAARGSVRLTEAPGDTAQHTYRVIAAR